MGIFKKREAENLPKKYTKKINQKNLIIFFLFSFILVSFSIIPFENNPRSEDSNSEGVGYSAMVKVYINGEFWDESNNILYNKGANMTRDFLGIATGTSPVTTIALCNSSHNDAGVTVGCEIPLVGGADLFNAYNICGLANATGTFSALVQGTAGANWSVQNTFTSTCDDLTMNVTRLQNGSDIFAGNIFTEVTLQTNDQITINWTISLT